MTSGQYVLFQHPIILSLDYDGPIWNSKVKYMDFEKFKKKLFSKGPPFENSLELLKMPIFNAFTKFAVVLSFFEIQTSPICQIKWFYRPVWDLDGEWLHHLPHHLPHVEPLVVHGGVHEVCSNFQNPHPFFPVIYVWGLIWDIVFEILTTNKETTPDVTHS